MIVCEQPKFVFVHIFKTAGTSIKRSLRRFAMPTWQEYANFVLKRIAVPQFGPPCYPDHFRASDLIREIGLEHFRGYFSFAFVRNPWDWELSHYKYILKQKSHQSHREVSKLGGFSEYLRWRCDGRFRLQTEFVTVDGRPVVDFVGRFENLADDFRYVCRKLGVSPQLPRLNQTRKSNYRDVYDASSRELVATTYAADIKMFDYRFDDADSGIRKAGSLRKPAC